MWVTGETTCAYCWLTCQDACPGTVWLLYRDMAKVVNWDIISQKIGSHYATRVNYKSVSSILKNKLSYASFLYWSLLCGAWRQLGNHYVFPQLGGDILFLPCPFVHLLVVRPSGSPSFVTLLVRTIFWELFIAEPSYFKWWLVSMRTWSLLILGSVG